MSGETIEHLGERPAGDRQRGRAKPLWTRVLGGPWCFIIAASVALLLGVVGMVWVIAHPESTAYRLFLEVSTLSLPAEQANTDEYLVFMGEDTPANRKQLLASSPHVSYVAESLFPGVFAVRVSDSLIETLETLRGQPYVKMVFQYNPSFGCH